MKRLSANTSQYLPAWPRVLQRGDSASALAGRYTLWMIGLAPTGDSLARGTLELTLASVTDIPHATSRRQSPLLGWADIDLAELGFLPVAHPINSRDRFLPGVRLESNPKDGRVTLMLGNSIRYGARGVLVITTHVGIRLYVHAIHGDTILGRWSGGGNITPTTDGYFCAWREPTDAT